MKGIVFTVLQQMVEEKLGVEVWDKIVCSTQLESGGSYTAAATYSDAEALALVGALSKETGIEPSQLLFSFGSFMFMKLADKYPAFLEGMTLIPFLVSVDRVIHGEVRKLYPGAGLPEFKYEEERPDHLVMLYRSERKLCKLAEGLISGAAERFGKKIQLQHPLCMHQGSDHCRLEIQVDQEEERRD